MSIIMDTVRGEIKFINGTKDLASCGVLDYDSAVCNISSIEETNNSRITELENQLEELTKRLNELVELKDPRDDEIIEAIEVTDEDFLALLSVDGERHG